MSEVENEANLGLAKDYLSTKYADRPGYLMVTARVMLVGFEPGHAHYVGVDFEPPPLGGPLGVSTVWDRPGVEMAQFAMAHGKRLCIVYRSKEFRWGDIVDIAVLDF